MQTSAAIPEPDLVKLFDFIDSETPSTATWIVAYLMKQGFAYPPQIFPAPALSIQVANFVARAYSGDIKEFARKMGNAFRVRKHRKNKDVQTLSISLDKATADQLAMMSQNLTKTEVVTRLIKGNYKDFLLSEKERRNELTNAKKQQQLDRDINKQTKLSKKASGGVKKVIKKSNSAKELLDQVASISAMLNAMSGKVESIEKMLPSQNGPSDLNAQSRRPIPAANVVSISNLEQSGKNSEDQPQSIQSTNEEQEQEQEFQSNMRSATNVVVNSDEPHEPIEPVIFPAETNDREVKSGDMSPDTNSADKIQIPTSKHKFPKIYPAETWKNQYHPTSSDDLDKEKT